MRRLAVMALAVWMGGCTTNGQPNSLGFIDQDSAIAALGLAAFAVLEYGQIQADNAELRDRAAWGHLPAPSHYSLSSSSDGLDIFPGARGGRPRSNTTHIDNPMNDTRARNRSGGFRNSWRIHNGDCKPQPTCTLR